MKQLKCPSIKGFIIKKWYIPFNGIFLLFSLLLSCVRLLCDPRDYSLPGSVRGILQARILSGFPCPPRWGDLPNPGIEPMSLKSPALAGEFFTTQRNQRSNCQHSLDHWKSKRVPEKHLFLLYWLCQSLWLCGSQ